MIGSVRQRTTFEALRTSGTRAGSGPVRVSWLPGPEVAVAFAIGRRFGTAVERNRARRRLRAAFVEAQADVPLSGTFLLIPSRGVLERRYGVLVTDLRTILHRLRSTATG